MCIMRDTADDQMVYQLALLLSVYLSYHLFGHKGHKAVTFLHVTNQDNKWTHYNTKASTQLQSFVTSNFENWYILYIFFLYII